jgi:hypothetical protein
MSNQNNKRPVFSLPSTPPPPPPLAAPAATPDFLKDFPLPWVVGPYGDVWVGADVEMFDPEKEAATEKVAGPNGSWWRSTCAKPRLVFETPANTAHKDILPFVVATLNGTVGK